MLGDTKAVFPTKEGIGERGNGHGRRSSRRLGDGKNHYNTPLLYNIISRKNLFFCFLSSFNSLREPNFPLSVLSSCFFKLCFSCTSASFLDTQHCWCGHGGETRLPLAATSGDVRLLCGFTAVTSSTQLYVYRRRTLALRGQLALVVLLSKAPRLVMLSFTTIVAELGPFGGLLGTRLLLLLLLLLWLLRLLLQNPLGNHARKAAVDGERHKTERVEGIVDTAVSNCASALR